MLISRQSAFRNQFESMVPINLRALNLFCRLNSLKTVNQSQYAFCSSSNNSETEKKKLKGFASFFEESESMKHSPCEQQLSFATLLRNSAFIDLGDPENKIVVGTIYHVVGDDLYIDFGWKFPTVCRRPRKNSKSYIQGTKVRLLIKDLELSTRFLGAKSDTALLEADCLLLGLAK